MDQIESKIRQKYDVTASSALLPRVLVSGMTDKMEDSKFIDALRNQNNLEIKQIKVIRQFEVKRSLDIYDMFRYKPLDTI